jgi:subtilisin family serine protease
LRPDLPVLAPGQRAVLGASVRGWYAGDALELTLAPRPAHALYARANSARAAGATRLDRSGIASLDRVAAALGGATFAPEFAGERVPPAGGRARDFTRYQIVHLPPGAGLAEALVGFAACPEVVRVSPLAVLPLDRVPDDSLYAQQWWLNDPVGHGDIDVEPAWDVTTGGSGVVVAVLDAGVLPYHPDLSGRVAGSWGNLWTNPPERDGLPGVDDDADGQVDDVWGWDFVDLPSAAQALAGEDWRDPDGDPNDMVGHGSACAGLIGALTNNVSGMAGIDWNARIMTLRVGWAYPGAQRGDGEVRMDFAAQAVRYATLHGARIISMSFGNLDTDGFGAAIDDAVAAGAVVVVASGNNGSPNDAARLPEVISVAATDRNAAVTLWSNVYEYTTLAAPGVGLQSLWSAGVGSDSLGLRTPAYSPPIDGTSFSGPQVAGAAALIVSRLSQLGQPLPDAYGMKLRLVETGRDIGASIPLLDVYAAVLGDGVGSAIRMGAPSIGAQAVLRLGSGDTRIVGATADSAMVALGGRSRDTLWVARLADLPVSGVAGAQMNAGYGVGLFCGTRGGTIEGFDLNGHPLPGFPTAATGVGLTGGPALGDLDGDGRLEVVCGADDGSVMAWHADGSEVTGWPRTVGAGRVLPVALANLDGRPGAEVIAACDDGHVTVMRGTGARVPGWPKLYPNSPRPPVVDTLGATHDTCIVFTEYDQLHALSLAGVERAGFPVAMGGPATSDMAVADLDGDRHDEIVLALDQPPRLAVFEADGLPLASGTWPRGIKQGLVGTPVIAPFPGATRQAVLLQRAGELIAVDQSGDSLRTFPQPGRAGAYPTIADVDGDGLQDVVAGTGPDPGNHFYIYRAGTSGVGGAQNAWPTPRGNSARTGSQIDIPSAFVPDATPPARVTDLVVSAVRDTFVMLRWSATGDDSLLGTPARYEVRAWDRPLDEANFGLAPELRIVMPTADAGAPESLHFGGLAPGARLHFALRAVDAAGNASPVSNDASAEMHVGGPLGDTHTLSLAPHTNPGSLPLAFYWHADPATVGTTQRLRLYDISGRLRFDRDLGTGAGGVYTWDGRDDHGSRAGAGIYFARLYSGAGTKTARVVLLP